MYYESKKEHNSEATSPMAKKNVDPCIFYPFSIYMVKFQDLIQPFLNPATQYWWSIMVSHWSVPPSSVHPSTSISFLDDNLSKHQ